MNKTELIEHIAKHADISKAAATRALESMIGAVKTTLKKGGSVSLVGFGTFAVGTLNATGALNAPAGAINALTVSMAGIGARAAVNFARSRATCTSTVRVNIFPL